MTDDDIYVQVDVKNIKRRKFFGVECKPRCVVSQRGKIRGTVFTTTVVTC